MAEAILILAEHANGEVAGITYEMLGVGRKMADELKAPLYAVLLGEEVMPLGAVLGAADRVFVVESPNLNVPPPGVVATLLHRLMEQKQVGLTLLGGTNLAMGVGSILALRSNLAYANFCRKVSVDQGTLVLTCQLLGGKIFSDVRFPENRGVVSVYPGAFQAEPGRSDRKPEIEEVDLPVEESKVVFKRFIEPERGEIDIRKQDFLVAVGRGIQNQDNLELAENLAEALGGVTCASRPVIDQGWIPLSRQVGKSGMTVKPKLYVALGISGAPEHVEGIQGSQLVIAINTDPQAPVFDVAHYGVCADLLEVVPALTEKLVARKG